MVGLQWRPGTAAASSCGATTITVTQKSFHEFSVDTGLTSGYVAYQIQTGASGSFSDLWVRAQNFSDISKLNIAATEDGLYHVGALGTNSSAYVYFYLTGAATNTAQTYNLNLFNGNPNYGGTSTCTSSVSNDKVVSEIKAAANKVTSVVSSAPYIGGTMTITVKGNTGTMSSTRPEGGVLSYTPASVAAWPADCYELYDTSISFTSGGNSGTYTHDLVQTNLNSPDTAYTVVYSFKAKCTTATPTSVTPVNYISSGGTNKKHTDTTTATYTAIPPIPPAANRLLLTKTVSPGGASGASTPTYTITVSNSAPISATLDLIQDTLPSAPGSVSYVNGTSQFNGSGISNPNIAGQTLTWAGNFTVPAGGSRSLTFQASVPATSGLYTNTAKGFVNTTQIDQTLDASDNVPATVGYGVGNPNLSGSTKTVSDLNGGLVSPGDTLRYTLNVINSGSTGATGVTITDPISSNTQNLTNMVVGASSTNCGSPGNTSTTTQLNLSNVAVAAGATCTITFDVTVKNSATDGAAVLNTATIGTPLEGGVGGTATSAPLAVRLVPSLGVTKTVDDTDHTVAAGQTVTYTVTISNTGATNATGVDLADTLTGPVTSVSNFTLSGGCGSVYTNDSAGSAIAISNVAVPMGGTCVVTYQAVVDPAATNGQTITNAADVGPADEGGNDPAVVNAPTLTVGIVPVPTLGVTKVDNDADNIVTPGQTVRYTVTISNTGSATGTTSFTDNLPAGMGAPSNFSYTNCGGAHSSSFSAPTLTVSGLSVATSANCVVAYDATINSPLDEGTTLTNSADVAAAAEGGNNPLPVSADTLTVDATPTLAVTEAEDDADNQVDPSQTVTYTITIANTGNGTATGVALTDHVTGPVGNLASINLTNCGGAYANNSSGVGLSFTGLTIAVGVDCVITYQTTVDAHASSGATIDAAADASAAAEGGNNPAAAAPSTLTVDVPTDLDHDGLPDSLESPTADRDHDGIPDDRDFDPQGYFYCSATGAIIKGGKVSVSGPGTVNLIADGSAGYYQWTAGATAGLYTMTVTPPAGTQLDPARPAASTLDPTGQPDPYSVGSSEYGSTGHLADFTAGANPYYLLFNLAPSDPWIIGNNIPLTNCATLAPNTGLRLTGSLAPLAIGFVAVALLGTGLVKAKYVIRRP